jgi:riboflavin-specific deaminase-like protein
MKDPDSPAWQLVRAAAVAARSTDMRLENGRQYGLSGAALAPVEAGQGLLRWNAGWEALPAASAALQPLLDLYLPFAGARASAPLVVGQIGQSIDGFIATATGHSHYVTGEASRVHLHCLRALCDCVIVGAGTVAADDPRLTTRLVEGSNPTRVVLDPQLRLPPTHHVFRDGQAHTLRVRARGVPLPDTSISPVVEDIELPTTAGRLDLAALLRVLRERGHQHILVEGGGITVSAFLAGSLLDRLHVVVAPFIMGEGRAGLRVPSPDRLQDCLRPPPRIYAMGNDVLFDCDLRAGSVADSASRVIHRVV